MKEYIQKEAAISFCNKVLGTDTAYSIETKNAFRAYRAYLHGLDSIQTTPCKRCKYATEKITPVGTIRYECLFDKHWRFRDGHCERGREIGE